MTLGVVFFLNFYQQKQIVVPTKNKRNNRIKIDINGYLACKSIHQFIKNKKNPFINVK